MPPSTLLVLLLAAGPAAADLPVEPGAQLVERPAGDTKAHRLACSNQLCAWHVSVFLGGCSSEDCDSHDLMVSDRGGRVLGASAILDPRSTVRFIGPRQVEITTPVDLVPHNPGGEPWDVGFAPVLMRQRLLPISPDGATFLPEKVEWSSPGRYETLRRLVQRPDLTGKPGIEGQVADTVLAKARAACASPMALDPVAFDCREGTCTLVLGSGPSRCGSILCALAVRGGEVWRVPIHKLVDQPDGVAFEESRVCFFAHCGGIKGGPGDEQCISRDRPDHMAFLETAGLHLEDGERYPARKADSLAAGRAVAPVVHAHTPAHVTWGLEAWKDAKDLSLEWWAVRAGDQLQLHVAVDDDVLVTPGPGAGVHADHLELEFSSQAARRPHLKLGALLAGEGKVVLRLWQRGEAGADGDVDEAYSASGTWARSERGYTADLSLPLAPLRQALEANGTLRFSIMASDADRKRRQETLLGTKGSLRLWDEYPPSVEEYARLTARLID